MGIRDYLVGHACCLVEWPERGQGVLPDPDLTVDIQYGGQQQGRRLRLAAGSPRGLAMLQRFQC
jgi:tRNA threonylcarbamoyladenosine biosynthesis protein TsaE